MDKILGLEYLAFPHLSIRGTYVFLFLGFQVHIYKFRFMVYLIKNNCHNHLVTVRFLTANNLLSPTSYLNLPRPLTWVACHLAMATGWRRPRWTRVPYLPWNTTSLESTTFPAHRKKSRMQKNLCFMCVFFY